MVDDEQRKRLEAEFHDTRERDRRTMSEHEWLAKYPNKKWYSVARQHRRYLDDILARLAPGSVALDYCCGLGLASLDLARAGANVHGIDISQDSVETARSRLADAGFGATSEFHTMDAEHMTFPDDMFDLIVCSGVLHHLDVNAAFPELRRVLKPNGSVVCIEALGYNPFIRMYRKATPSLRTAWEAKHILTLREVDVARRYFDEVSIRFFYLFTILGVAARKTRVFEPVLRGLELVDSFVTRIPGLRRWSWQMVFVLSNPRSQTG